MGDTIRFVDDSGDTRLAGELHDDGATVGDVLTVQADGTLAAAAGGGGGSGNAVVRGPFSFAFDTAGLAAGVAFYTPTVGDFLLDAWIEIDTAFNGTTPFADIGTFNGVTSGLFSGAGFAVDLTLADSEWNGAGMLLANGYTGLADTMGASNAGDIWGVTVGAPGFTPLTLVGSYTSGVRATSRFTAANPLLLVASRNGQKGGTAIDSTQGAGRVYIVTATPTAF